MSDLARIDYWRDLAKEKIADNERLNKLVAMQKRDMKNAIDENQRLTARVAELKAVSMSPSERRDLLSKEHYRDKIERLTAENERLRHALLLAKDYLDGDEWLAADFALSEANQEDER